MCIARRARRVWDVGRRAWGLGSPDLGVRQLWQQFSATVLRPRTRKYAGRLEGYSDKHSLVGPVVQATGFQRTSTPLVIYKYSDCKSLILCLLLVTTAATGITSISTKTITDSMQVIRYEF